MSDALREIESELAKYSGENELLREELNAVRAMMDRDEQGWIALSSFGDQSDGLSLNTLKDISCQAREMAVGNPLIDRALGLRYSYVWSKGVTIPGVEEDPGRRGPKSGLNRFYRNPINQRYVFGDEAKEAMENAAGTDGAFLLIGDDSTKEMRSIPISEVGGVFVNPDFPAEIWAILRTWNPNPGVGTTVRQAWYYSDTYTGTRQKSIQDETGKRIPVAQGYTLLDVWFNRQTGWALGVPDATAAILWARIYSELVHNGRIMTEALARFVAQVKAKSPRGAKNVGVKMGGGGVGQTAVTGEGNELSVFQSAGKTYDFNGIRPVAALVATSMEVSIIHLLSDPGAAGSSYGSASNLDLPTKRAMVARQNTWKSFLERIIKWGTDQEVNVSFPSLDDPDPYREAQIAALAWNSGLVHEDEARPRFLTVANMTSKHASAPEGVLLPNNEESWQRADIDPQNDPNSVATSTGSPDQGRSNTGGGTDSTLANDLATEMRISSLLDRLEELAGKIID